MTVARDAPTLEERAPALTADRPERGLRRLVTGRAGRRRTIVPRWLRRLSGPAALVLLWWALTASGKVSPSSFPRPSDVVDVGIKMIRSGELTSALRASLKRVLMGLSIGVFAGAAIATLAGLTRRGEDIIDSTMQLFKAIPAFALVPLFIIWFGIYEAPKVALIAWATSLPIYINMYGAIRNVDAQLVDLAHTLGLGRRGLVRHIIIPGAVPGFLTGLRFSMASAWLALIVAEQINANNGLGRLLAEARSWYRLDILVMVIVVYGVLGLTSYAFVRFLERRLLRWRRGFQGE
jgi:sulfonate transport system permease protein